MATTILKGESALINANFRRGLTFAAAPTWTLYDWNDEPMQRGTATPADGGWQAEITVPANLSIPDAAQTVALEFAVRDTSGDEHILSKDVELLEAYDESRPYGLLWDSSATSLYDTILLDREPTKITAVLREGYGAGKELGRKEFTDLSPVRNTGRGALYEIELPDLTFKKSASGGYYPFQLVLTASYASGPPDTQIRPVYGLTPLAVSKLNTLKRYLDKGQFTDIDPNLQWGDEEMMHFLQEGVQYLNANPPEMTFWTLDDLPSPLDKLASMAAAWEALNARYLAEGLSSFNFASSGVSLDWDRKETLATKMEELKGALDSILMQSKRAAIKAFGVGTPQAGGPGRRPPGALAVNAGPMLNSTIRPGFSPIGLGARRYW